MLPSPGEIVASPYSLQTSPLSDHVRSCLGGRDSPAPCANAIVGGTLSPTSILPVTGR